MANPFDAAFGLAEEPEGGNQFDAEFGLAAPVPGGNGQPTKITVSPPPDKPEVGQGEALLRGMVSGATANFGDELSGAEAASGLPRGVPVVVRAPVGAARLAYENLVGGEGDASRAYDEAVAESRRRNEAAFEQHPVTNTLGTVGGAVALPVTRAAQGAALGGRALRAAITGAGYGALAGAGEGQTLGGRALKAAGGAVLGGAIGAAGVPAVEGIGAVLRKVTEPLRTAWRGLRNPEGEAARRVVTAIDADVRNAPPGVTPGLTPQEFTASNTQGGPATIMDLGGETTRALARSAANTVPAARETLNRAIDARFEGQTPRLTSWLEQTFHYPNAHAQQQAIEETASRVNSRAYQTAYRHPNAQGLWDEGFEQIAQAPEVQSAIRKVLPQSASASAREGFTPIRNPFRFNQQTGRMELTPLPDGTMPRPNLQFWDEVKKNLDKGDWSSREWSRILRQRLDEIVPDYRTARSGAAHFFGAENALEAGQNFVGAGNRFGNREARAAISRMSETERQLFQDGYVSRLVERLNSVPDRRSIINQIYSTPNAREEIVIALGQRRAAELEAMLRVEGIMDLARGAVQGNSTTARQLAEIGIATGVGGIQTYQGDPTAAGQAAVVYGILRGQRAIDERVVRRVAEMLASNDPAVLARGIALVARNERIMNALRAADRRLAGAFGQQSSGVIPGQAGRIGRTEDDEPGVPRPPGQ